MERQRESDRQRLDEAELAHQSTSTPARVRKLVEIGVLQPDEHGHFDPADVQRIRIVAAFEEAGIELAQIAGAIRERRMSFEYTDRIYPEASPPSGRTVGDLATELGVSEELLSELLLALGLPRPGPDQSLTAADMQQLPAFIRAWATDARSPETVLRAARLLGEATRRVAEGWVDLFIETIAPPQQELVDATVEDLRPSFLEPGMRIAQLLEPATIWLERHHLARALDAANIEATERALEARGQRAPATYDPPAVVFADMSGFTRLTEEHGDELAVRYAAELSRLSSAVAAGHGGRLVKQLGDGVMLVFRHVGDAVAAAFALRSSADPAGLPPLHIGLTAGPVVERDGDYFGRTVNLASRASEVAGPGEVVANETAAVAASEARVTALGPTELKGLLSPIPLFRLDDAAER